MSMEEMSLDEIIKRIGRAIEEDQVGTHVTDPERMREFMVAGEAMKYLFEKKGTRVDVLPHEHYPTVGVIRVTTRNLEFKDPELFSAVASRANNYEIYPKLDGTIVLALTFYGLTKKA